MHFITLRGYGVNTREVTVDMDKVNHFYQILYKEHSGTTLVMDNGAEISVSQRSWEILMFEFFRTDRNKDETIGINPGYWAEIVEWVRGLEGGKR